MVWLYHGTRLENAISIARTGAILSPLQRQIEIFKRIGYPEDYKKAAEESVFSLYSEHEREHRVKCVSFSIDDFGGAEMYAMRCENSNGGLVLGLELDKEISTMFLFVPEKMDLTYLRKIYMSPKAVFHSSLIRQEFDKYNVSYEAIR